MNEPTINKNIIVADTTLLQQAISDEALLICDMRPPTEIIRSPVRRSLFIQINSECATLLHSMLRLKSLNLLVISSGDYLIADVTWIQNISNRKVYVFDSSSTEIPAECMEPIPIKTVTAEALADISAEARTPTQLLDIRTTDQYNILHIAGSQNISLSTCWNYIHVLDHEHDLYVYGYEDPDTLCFIQLMQYWGYHNLYIVLGGFPALEQNNRFYMCGNNL